MVDQFVQGDIMFVRVCDDVVSTRRGALYGASDQYTKIVARGEKTGHAHVIEGNGDYCPATRTLVAREDVVVEHEEHPSLSLLKGSYTVTQQRTHDYQARESRPIVD